MNDQWKQLVADAYDAFGDCAPATPVRRFLRLIDAQDAVVKAASNHCFALRREREVHAGEFPRDKVIEAEADALAFERELSHALRALAELKLE